MAVSTGTVTGVGRPAVVELPEPDFKRIFEETPAPLLLLTPDFVIVHANRARLEATATTLEATVGRGLFEVFPMNPEDPGADGLVNLRDSLNEALTTGRPVTMAIQKYDIPLPDGTWVERFWSPRNVPILDEEGRVVWLLHRADDITDYVHTRELARTTTEQNEVLRERADRVEADLFARTRELEQLVVDLGRATVRAELTAARAEEATRAQRAAAARTAEITESMAVGYLAMDAGWVITYVNTEAVHALGLPREQLVGGVIWELFPATVGTDFEVGYRRAAQTGEQVVFEAYYPAPLDAWYEVRATPEAGGVALYFIDITARHHAQAAVQTAGERLSALGRIALGLTDAEDVQALAAVMAEQGLAALGADGGAVAVPDPDHPRMLRSYITASYGEQVQADYGLLPLDAQLPVCAAARTGQAVRLVDAQTSAAYSVEMAQVVQATGCQAWASIPLLVGGELVGVLTAGWSAPQTFDADQVELLEAYAAQCAQALARLAARDGERAARAAEQVASSVVARFSETVQRSLLTSPTTPDDLDIAVRYAPAAAEAYVGGDWYDAFTTAAGVTTVVIGDVAGHDRNAAAAMAQLRNLLRGISYTVSDPPAAVLSTLDHAAAAMGVEAMATCVLAAIEQSPAQRAAGVRILRWSNAGHPAPLLITADGQVAHLHQEGTDLVIGIDPSTARHDHLQDLGPGDVVLLFTDGLVERRGTGLDLGLGWLREAVAVWARLQLAAGTPLDPGALCDALLAQVEGHCEDDVALLVLRAAPQPALAPHEDGEDTKDSHGSRGNGPVSS